MRLLAVFAHPVPESFGAALLDAVREGAEVGGHPLRVIDLHAEAFDPVMGAEERRGYDDPRALPSALGPHIEALAWAEGIVFVHPTWWGGLPAILKGWLDRCWRPGLAFHLDERGMVRPAMTHLRLLCQVTTTGASRWGDAVANTPGRRTLFVSTRACTGRGTRALRLALHGIDATTNAQRRAFLVRVASRIAALR